MFVSLAMSQSTPQAAGSGTADAAYANPKQSDPNLELARLRAEGVAHFESGIGLKKALAAFEAAVRIRPNSAIEQFNLGATQRKLGNVDRAIEALTAAQRLDPGLTHAAYTLGLLHRGRGDTPAAINAFESALKSSPTDPATYYQLGRLYREQNREAEALQAYINALQLAPQHPGTMYQLYLYYQEHGEQDRARAMFNEFARVKRAISSTRKELNDDETDLARPFVTATGDTRPGPNAPTLRWRETDAVKGERAGDFVLRDVDSDGLDDLLVGTRDGTLIIYHNDGKSFVEQARLKAPVEAEVESVAAETLVRGETDRVLIATSKGLLVSSKDLKSPASQFVKVTSTDARGGITFADIDHDGDVDVIVGAFREVLLNDGAGGLRPANYLGELAKRAAAKQSGPLVAIDMLDRNGIDFVLPSASGDRLLIADNLGGIHAHAAFTPLTGIKKVRSAVAADMDNDSRVDIVTSSPEGVQIDYHDGRDQFTSSGLSRMTRGEDGTITVGDFDNDGWKDLLAIDSLGARLWRNVGARKFTAQSLVKISGSALLSTPVASDTDGDGQLDLVALTTSGDIRLLKNETAGLGKATRIELTGIRSAPSGLHTTVELRRGNLYQKYVSSGRPLLLPLGSAGYAEVVRIGWPNGFIESKLKVDSSKLSRFKESERVSGSCPSVFAWDGRQFRYISDAFISGPMGVPFGPKSYFPVDHDEYLAIPGEALREDQGRLRIAITEELREAVFLDQVHLLAVDHPADTQLYPNEYLYPGDFPEFKLHFTARAQASIAAVDQDGNDVTALVAHADRRYLAAFRQLQYEGFAEDNSIELQLPPDAAFAPSLRLFLTGWFHYFESTSIVAASQRPDLKIGFPSVEVWDNGLWRKLLEFGLPNGKDKTVVVDLTHRLPPGAQRIRVRSNLALYWDRIVFDAEEPPHESEITRLKVASAQLRFRGFSGLEKVAAGAGRQPERFDYQSLRVSAPWDPLDGRYTRYGGVGPLLTKVDSQMAVFGSGDEVLLEFDTTSSKPPRAGWRRDYLLYLDGFVKDGDKYTAHPGRLEPLPFAGMKRYPYELDDPGRQVLDSPEYHSYLKRYQTRAPLSFTGPRLARASQDKESRDANQ